MTWGILSGNLQASFVHREIDEAMFRIEKSYDLEPERRHIDHVGYGFAAAIRDIAELSATERYRTSLPPMDNWRAGTDAAFVELVRAARSRGSAV